MVSNYIRKTYFESVVISIGPGTIAVGAREMYIKDKYGGVGY